MKSINFIKIHTEIGLNEIDFAYITNQTLNLKKLLLLFCYTVI